MIPAYSTYGIVPCHARF